MIFGFLLVVGVPCFYVALWGSKMINDLGNHPSRAARIQAAAGWKVLLVEIVSFALLIGWFIFLYNLQNE
ncbi:MAG: hypothetical protein KGJ09_04465 [Candidatus Omnitrophica bacterium]|nr:hypothetical protein [Candidatus Omnitrophota bacterium]MDE2009314.1 hypothetical protein [Candidatus Omnitrophota bacterium]